MVKKCPSAPIPFSSNRLDMMFGKNYNHTNRLNMTNMHIHVCIYACECACVYPSTSALTQVSDYPWKENTYSCMSKELKILT